MRKLLQSDKLSKASNSLSYPTQPQEEDEPLTEDGKRMKVRLSHIPFWRKRTKNRNSSWNNLGSSHINL